MTTLTFMTSRQRLVSCLQPPFHLNCKRMRIVNRVNSDEVAHESHHLDLNYLALDLQFSIETFFEILQTQILSSNF